MPSTKVEDVQDDAMADPYVSSHEFTPLIRRSLALRLDVGPFGLAYIGLICLDCVETDHDTATPSLLFQVYSSVSIVSLLFLAVLVAHVSVVILSQWSVTFRSDIGYQLSNERDMTHCLVASQHSVGIVPVNNSTEGTSSSRTIQFQDKVFRYSHTHPDADEALWNISSCNTSAKAFRPIRYPTNLKASFYQQWKGHETLQSAKLAHSIYGANTTLLQLPTFFQLLATQVVAPFFLFQLFCVLLWSLDEYWYYAIFTLLALLMFESTVAYNRLKSLERLQSISHKNIAQHVYVFRNKRWMRILVRELLPGDLVSLSGTNVSVPADVLVLAGTAVVDEALLTGESVPQRKQAFDTTANDQDCLDMQDSQHKESILFGGTVLLVATPPEGSDAPDKGVQGMVLRTGFETAQGNLLRTMAHTSKTSDGVHTMDTFVFILLLVFCAIGAAAFVLQQGWHDDRRNRFRLLLHVIIIVTSVVPPELPMELSLAVTNSVSALMHRCQVYCTEHFRIPWAGEVTVCCFDKTGTLTSDTMLLKGVRLSTNNSDNDQDEEDALMFPSGGDFPRSSLLVMAACHSLAIAVLGERHKRLQVIGDPLEQEVLKHTGYQLMGGNMVESADDSQKKLTILHRFAFSSKLKRMTVLVSEQGSKGKLLALTKGAPETIKEFLSADSLPEDYDDVAFHHMSRGRRVLAMAYRDVGSTKNLRTLKDSGRDALECNLTFAGFLVLDCPLKPDSKPVITELKKSGHRAVMITGDAILTAAEVARQVGIVKKEKAGKRIVYVIRKRSTDGTPDDPLSKFECFPLRSRDKNPATMTLSQNSIQDFVDMTTEGKASFCIDGATLVQLAVEANQSSSDASKMDEKHLLLNPASQAILTKLVPLVSVFARHSPHQKEAVVAAFNNGGSQTLMCGDGTNDVGALKRAHVGISIVSAPEVESKHREAVENISKAKSGSGKTKKKRKSASIEESLRQLREAQQELDEVELGDASVAAPFTSRAISIKCCKDVIQQGRCTLVTMLQIYKILGINCLVNALVLSKLFLHGAKQGDRQLTILGIVVAALFYFVTRAEPLSELSSIRPPASVLCIQALVSITGQFLIHLVSILLVTDAALAFVDPYDPSLVPDGPFNPNVLNTVTFMLMCLSTINTFAVNYRGRPFMKGLKENKLFYRSLQICYAVLVICSLEVFPPLNDLLQLTTLPSTHEATGSHFVFEMVPVDFPVFVTALMALNTLLSFAFERAVLRAF